MEKLREVDREAMARAIELTLAGDDHRRVEQVKRMLEHNPWEEVGRFCSYHRQMEALKLMPWQAPPVWGDARWYNAASRLLRRLLKRGLSRYEPEPVEALRS